MDKGQKGGSAKVRAEWRLSRLASQGVSHHPYGALVRSNGIVANAAHTGEASWWFQSIGAVMVSGRW